jgi:hypothetical protein
MAIGTCDLLALTTHSRSDEGGGRGEGGACVFLGAS